MDGWASVCDQRQKTYGKGRTAVWATPPYQRQGPSGASTFAEAAGRPASARNPSVFVKPSARRVPGRSANEMCHTTKRTHRFLKEFLM